jgi:hypothetical protein
MSGWRMQALPRAALGCGFALLIAGSVPAAWPGQAAATADMPLQAQFFAAATEFGVPTAVLAVSHPGRTRGPPHHRSL